MISLFPSFPRRRESRVFKSLLDPGYHGVDDLNYQEGFFQLAHASRGFKFFDKKGPQEPCAYQPVSIKIPEQPAITVSKTEYQADAEQKTIEDRFLAFKRKKIFLL